MKAIGVWQLSIILILLLLTSTFTFGATCTFNGDGDGTSWSDDDNWSCGHAPDPSSDHVIIPAGYNVINDEPSDFSFENRKDFTIHGSLDMSDKKIEIKHNKSFMTISFTGRIFDTKELFFNSGGSGLIEYNSNVDVEHLKIDDNSELTLHGCCINVNFKIENLSSAGITGTGCIEYSGSNGNFVNTGSGGILGCSEEDLDDCTLDDGACRTLLPIELIYFDAVPCSENTVCLSWQTASELNNAYFMIERSKDAINWKDIVELEGSGFSDAIINYEAKDEHPIHGINYYRLKQIDYDGSSTYSQIKAVNIENQDVNQKVQIYPNPANKLLHIKGLLVGSEIRIFNPIGQDVTSRTQILNQNSLVSIDLSNLEIGMYILRANDAIELFYKF